MNSEEILIHDRHQTLQNSQLTRPKATTLAYERKQREFKSWCATMAFHDGETVTCDKINRYLLITYSKKVS